MARYNVVHEPQRLSFCVSRQVYADRLRYLLVCLGFIALAGWGITHPAVHPIPFRDAFSVTFFTVLAPLALGAVILITLARMVTGGAIYVLDRSKHLLERNGRPLCVLDALHHVELRLGYVQRYNRYQSDHSTVILSLLLVNGREIVLDQTQNEAEAAALGEQIASFAGVPFGPMPMPSHGFAP
jgi:hypothetical protein